MWKTLFDLIRKLSGNDLKRFTILFEEIEYQTNFHSNSIRFRQQKKTENNLSWNQTSKANTFVWRKLYEEFHAITAACLPISVDLKM